MKLLAIDTCGADCSVAVIENGAVLAAVYEKDIEKHSKTLLKFIDGTLKEAVCGINEIEKIAVTAGPGSFTGLRIGMATAKGLAAARRIPIIQVSSLYAAALSAYAEGQTVLSMIDARNDSFYYAFFKCSDGLKRLTEDDCLEHSEIKKQAEKIGAKIVTTGPVKAELFGPAVEKEEGVSPEKAGVFYMKLPQAARELQQRRMKDDRDRL